MTHPTAPERVALDQHQKRAKEIIGEFDCCGPSQQWIDDESRNWLVNAFAREFAALSRPQVAEWNRAIEAAAVAVSSQGFYRDEGGEKAAEIIRALAAAPSTEMGDAPERGYQLGRWVDAMLKQAASQDGPSLSDAAAGELANIVRQLADAPPSPARPDAVAELVRLAEAWVEARRQLCVEPGSVFDLAHACNEAERAFKAALDTYAATLSGRPTGGEDAPTDDELNAAYHVLNNACATHSTVGFSPQVGKQIAASVINAFLLVRRTTPTVAAQGEWEAAISAVQKLVDGYTEEMRAAEDNREILVACQRRAGCYAAIAAIRTYAATLAAGGK